jgi:hypothetical protein
MKLRQWHWGIAAAAAALIPLSATADTVMNLPASPNYVSDGLITIDYTGVEVSDGTVGSGVHGGTCATGGSSPTGCAEEGFGVGSITALTINGLPVWSSGIVSAANPNGYALAFVLYGTADLSDVTSGTNTTADSVGANAVAQTVTYTAPVGNKGPTSVTFTGDGEIHIDLYYMPVGETPCFQIGLGCTAANLVQPTDRTGFGTVDGISNAVGGGLFAQLTLASGLVPLNAVDGVSNGAVTLVGNFDTDGGAGGKSNAYATCDVSGPTTPPACSNFQPVTESFMDTMVTGYSGDPAFADTLIDAFFSNQIHFATTPQGSAGWTFNIHDPVNAVTPLPEPTSLAILGSALGFVGVAIRRRRRNGMTA